VNSLVDDRNDDGLRKGTIYAPVRTGASIFGQLTEVLSMLTRCLFVGVGLLGVLSLVGGCGAGATGGAGNPDGGSNVGGGGSLGSNSGLGQPCVLGADAGAVQAVYNNQALACPSGLCLKPVQQAGSYSTVDTAPYCASECSTDNDCTGATRDPNNPNDKRCMRGYACGVAFVVGPFCCKKLCLCKDFLGTAGLSTPLACDPAQNQGLLCQGAASAGEPLPNPQQETDLSVSLAGSLAGPRPACVDFPLIDTVSSTPGIQADCQVRDRGPCSTPGTNGCSTTGYKEAFLPECKDAQGSPLDPASLDPGAASQPLHTQAQIDAVLATVSENSRPCWYLSYDNSASGCATAYNGQRISVLWPTGTVPPAGSILAINCLTCATYDPACATAGQ
jgi:hypothetical protein